MRYLKTLFLLYMCDTKKALYKLNS